MWLIVLGGGAVLFFIYGWDNPRQKYLLEYGEEVKGTVTGIIRGNRLYKLKIEYLLKGVRYQPTTKNLLNTWWPKFEVGQAVRVFVDPANVDSFVVYETSAYRLLV